MFTAGKIDRKLDSFLTKSSNIRAFVIQQRNKLQLGIFKHLRTIALTKETTPTIHS